MSTNGSKEARGKISRVLSFSNFWGYPFLHYGICSKTWLVVSKSNDLIPFLHIQSKYSSLLTDWNTSYMSRDFTMSIILKTLNGKKLEILGGKM
jgi:hypothetical protein